MIISICAFIFANVILGGATEYCSNTENKSRIFACNANFSQTLTINPKYWFANASTQTNFNVSEEIAYTGDGIHLDYVFANLPPFAATRALSEQCRLHSEIFLQELRDLKLWALQMYDSSAKPSSGLLNGNIVMLGDYDQCLAVEREAPTSDGSVIKGQYCVATIYVEPLVKPRQNWHRASSKHRALHELVDMMQSHNAMTNDYDDDMRFLPTFNPISYAVCVPSSCSGQDLQHALSETLAPYNLTSGLDLKVVVAQNSCMNDRSNPIETGAIAISFFLVAIISFAVAGTYFEKSHTDDEGQLKPTATQGLLGKLLVTFSFRKNWRMLIDTNVPEDELSCVHGLRAIASFFIYVIHRSVFTMFYPFTNRTQVAEILEGDWTMLFRAFWNWVDSFVILSGLLTSFYAFKRLKSGRSLNIPRMYLQRYIKFTPMLLVLALMTQHLLQHLVNGPQLIRVIDHYVQNCKRGMLPVITYTNVFEGFENMCYPPSHQLATDMHMYLIAPFLILGVWRWPRAAPFAVLTSLVGLGALKYFIVLKHELGSFLFYGVSIKQMVMSANRIYINAVHRLTPYIFGLGLGYILNVTNARLSRVQMAAGSACAVASALYSFYGVAHVARRGYIYDATEAAAFAVVQPLLWSFSLCWLVYCCATQQAPGWLTRFLKWPGFVIYSRLSYAIYLVQILVIAIGVGQVMTPEYFTFTKMIDLNEISAVALASLVCTLLFLLPLADLWNICTGAYKPPVYAKHSPPVSSECTTPKECLD